MSTGRSMGWSRSTGRYDLATTNSPVGVLWRWRSTRANSATASVGKERGELLPRRPPQPRDRGIGLAPLLLELLERGPGGLHAGRGVDRPQVLGELVPVLA